MPRTISILCSLLGYSRQALYQGQKFLEKELYSEELVLQKVKYIRLKQPRVGGRRLLLMMDKFMGEHEIVLGRDKFFDLLSCHALLVRKRKRNKPITTNSYHRFKKYKNIIKEFIPNAANQLWVCDITYITLEIKFAYLSLITDAYSHKIVGFCLHKTLEAEGSLRALKMALKASPDSLDLIHHSDRGIQCCCNNSVWRRYAAGLVRWRICAFQNLLNYHRFQLDDF